MNLLGEADQAGIETLDRTRYVVYRNAPTYGEGLLIQRTSHHVEPGLVEVMTTETFLFQPDKVMVGIFGYQVAFAAGFPAVPFRSPAREATPEEMTTILGDLQSPFSPAGEAAPQS